MKLYGIKTCDTVKKARKFLDEAGVSYAFHDYKKDGVDIGKLERFAAEFGWETVLNRRGTTWRKLDDAVRDAVTDAAGAIAVMRENPSTIKRPIVEGETRNFIGFDPEAWKRALERGDLK